MKESAPSGRIMWIILGVLAACVALTFCAMAVIVGWYYGEDWFQISAPISTVPPLIDDGPGTGAGVGNAAPDFVLRSINGEQVSLSGYRGRAVLVNFWATWCDFCLEEMPMIQDYFQRYTPVLAVLAVDEGESSNSVSYFVQQQGYTFPVLLDRGLRVGNLYLVTGYPRSFFIDRSGIIRYVVVGEMSEEDMEAGLISVGVIQ